MDSFDIMKYIEMAHRRKYWIIIPFLLSCLTGFAYYLKTPKIFEAETLILVQPQKVPTEFVRSIVSVGIDERLRTITQEVTSRTNLEKTIKAFDLYEDSEMLIDDKVLVLREKIKINVVRGGRGGEAFTIAFRGKDPQKVMQVTNALASNFITENLKIRESQALGTSAFLADELESITKRLSEKEAELREYREKYMGSLPDQLQTNLNILGRLQNQMEQLSSNLNEAESRKLVIQEQLTQAGIPIDSGAGPGPEMQDDQGLESLKKQLSILQGRYTGNHPDIIRLKKTIEHLESAPSQQEIKEKKADGAPQNMTSEPRRSMTVKEATLTRQLQEIELERNLIKAEIRKVKSKMEMYQNRVEETPEREEELLTLSRDYDNLKSLYDSMLKRKLEAEIAVSMEKKQKGEQFRVIDPAKVPTRPVEPDMKKILLITLVLGLGLGGGLAYLIEWLDTSFKTPEEVESTLKVPVLVGLPMIYTESEMRKQKVKEFALAGSVIIGFVISAFGIFIAAKGWSSTMDYIRMMTKI